jgi:potassium-dependent mechanosensitive channel
VAKVIVPRLLGALHLLRLAAVPAAAPLALLTLWHAQGWLAGAFGAVLGRGLIATVLLAVGVALLYSHSTVGSNLLRPELQRFWLWRATALLGAMATICGLAALAMLAPLLPGSSWRANDPALRTRRHLAHTAAVLLAILPLLAAVLGRGVLSTYLFSLVLAAWIVISAMAQLRHVLRAAMHAIATKLPAHGAASTADADDADGPARMAGYWAATLVDVGLALLAFQVLLLLLDVPQAQIDYWTGLVLGDVQIGNAVISLPNIFLALLVLAGGLFASSQLRRWLGKSVLPQSGMEIGLRTSIAAGAGYLGMVVAFLAAVATAGVSLSSVAIVARALSVGMGFGLRTVVENFVAGLLMLIERPIRVGDWVVIGSTEGTVRRISVRATEIETFDAASVIVPNSLFVSSPVTNWTLQNRRARLRIKLGVAYGTKPREVQEALLACARGHKHVTAFPAPQALFTDFGDSALLFELRCHVRDTDLFPVVRSELMAAIDQAMCERGIEIPFPQQVIHRGHGWEEPAVEEPDQDLPPPVAIRPAS